VAAIELPASIDNASDAKQFLGDVVWNAFETERRKLASLAEWSSSRFKPEYLIPPRSSREKRALQQLSKVPWLGLVVETFTQALLVDGYRKQGSPDNVKAPWETWNANRMHARQMGIHRAALRYGYAFASALPGEEEDVRAVLRGLSPTRCFALYDDPVNDDYPRYAIEWLPSLGTVRLYNEDTYFGIPMSEPGKFPNDQPVEITDHGVGVVPIVRYLNMQDLDGYVKGEVEDLIPVASCLDKTKYDRLLAQHFNSWRVRWATGLDNTSSPNGDGEDPDDRQFLAELAHSDTLVATDPNAKFGTLDPTPLADMITAYVRDLCDLEDNAQLPPNWSGGISAVTPDALAELRGNTRNKIEARQVTFGDGHNQLLRLAAQIQGDDDTANDFSSSVTWVDSEVRSLSQAVDAWGKAHLLLGAPARALWRKIVPESEAENWEAYFESKDPMDQELLYWGQNTPVPQGEGANAPQPNAEPTQLA
jgi:hypothetical protein